jgi:peptidoglycan/xylan/chitin deacetylase (PgdA/CDA1 family)
MRAYVLTYHSGNIAGDDHARNDLIALAEDLERLRAMRVPVVPLRSIVDALLSERLDRLPERVAAITLDDGLDFDFVDLVHPFHGAQRSVASILRDFAGRHREPVHATSFVIASPEARREIAAREMLDHQWIGEHWWNAAIASGQFHIASHSWDHRSPSVRRASLPPDEAGSFSGVATYEEADLQVRAAHDYIAARAPNPGAALFACPYGDASDYFVEEYLPTHGVDGGTIAAFTGGASPVHAGSPRWRLPRFTCGSDWRSAEELESLLRA